MTYFDTSYLARLYLEDAGWQAVRKLAAQDDVVCAVHGRGECMAALHRAHRERRYDAVAFLALLDQFEADCAQGAVQWLPLEEGVFKRLHAVYRKAPVTTFLRGADALHLACAREHGCREIYSNDRHLLAAAPLFGVAGKDII